ncbi:MAG: hypothetical protein AAGE52_42325, partial [Myxococcota bacterium]
MRYLLPLVFLVGCFGSRNRDTERCDCCGTTVEIEAGETCASGVCDPFCSRRIDPDGGVDGAVDAGFDSGVDAGDPMTCDCCGTEVTIDPDQNCDSGVCDPFCLVGCEERPIDLICGYSHIPAGTPTTLPVQIGGRDQCFCGETVQCSVGRPGSFTLELSTELCSAGALCDACFPFVEGTCNLPALEEGTWTVNVNGQPSFELGVIPSDVLPERGSVCQRRADHDSFCGVTWPARAYDPGLVCHPGTAPAGTRIAIEVTDSCGGCGSIAGECRVDVFDNIIRVQPRSLASACDIDCPAVCIEREDVCYTPPLDAGTWQIEVGDYTSTIEVGTPLGPEEVCGPFIPPTLRSSRGTTGRRNRSVRATSSAPSSPFPFSIETKALYEKRRRFRA